MFLMRLAGLFKKGKMIRKDFIQNINLIVGIFAPGEVLAARRSSCLFYYLVSKMSNFVLLKYILASGILRMITLR